MAGRARTLKLKTEVEVTGADKIKSLGQTLKGALNPTNIAKGLAGGFIASEAFQFIEGAISAAAEFEDTVAATGVVIGTELQAPMEKWAETAAEAFGASKQDAIAAANQMAVFGKSAGLSGQELVDFSQDLTQLGGDLASMFGGSTTDAIGAVGAALRGESEPIRRYGVLLDDATLRNRAFELGLISTTKNALTPQQRVLAAQAEIMAQTSDAQGDFARTSDGMANTQRRLAAEFENVNIEIGRKLLPIALDLANFVADDLLPILKTAIDVVAGVGSAFGGVADVLNGVMGGVQGSALAVRGVIDGMIGALFGIPETEKTIVAESSRNWEKLQDQYVTAVNANRLVTEEFAEETERQWKRIAAEPVSQMSAQARAIREAGFQTQVSYAKGLLDGQNQPLVQLEALKQLQEESLDNAAEIARLKGQLNSTELAAGMADTRDVVRAQAEATRQAIISRLATLGVDASNWGYGIGLSLASGLNRGYGVVVDAAGNLASAVRGQIGIESEPKDHNSPLHGITKWGVNAARTFADGLASGTSLISSALAQMATGSNLPTTRLSAATVAAGGGGNTVINNIYLQWDGEPPKGRSEAEIVANLQRLSPLIGGKLAPGY